MKRISTIVLFLVLLCSAGRAQQYLVDSLSQILPRIKNPVQKIDILLGLSRASLFVEKQKAASAYAFQALKLSQKNKYRPGEAMALLFLEQVQSYSSPNPDTNYVREALKIARSIPSKSVEAFAIYHLAEQYMYRRNDYNQAIKLLEEALPKVDKTVPDKHIGNMHKVLGLAYMTSGDSAKTRHHLEQALYHFTRVKTHPFIVPELGHPSAMDADGGALNKIQVLLYLSRTYHNQGRLPKALKLALEALDLAKQQSAESTEAWAHEELAINYIALGTFDRAIDNYQKAIRIYEKKQALFFLSASVQELGSLFFRLRDYPTAEQYYLKSLSIKRNNSDTLGMVQTYQRLGQVATALKHNDLALQYYEEAILLNTKLKDSTTLSPLLMGIGGIRLGQKKYPQALKNYRRALKLDQHFNNQVLIIGDLIGLSRLFLHTNQLDSAGKYADAVQVLVAKGSLEQQKIVQEIQSQISEQKGDYVAALQHYKTFHLLHDSIYSNNAQAKLKQEQVRQNVVDYQKEKEQAEREAALLNVRNRLYFALALAFLGLILIGGYLLLQLRKAQQELKAQNLQLQNLNHTKDKFFGIIAHDIRSPMVALEGVGEQMAFYLKKQQGDKLERLADQVDKTARHLNNLLDNLLNWALLQQGVIPYRPQSINISGMAEEVLEMFQPQALSKNILLENHIVNDLSVYADTNTLQAILRNLLSNAIKFTPSGGKVSLSTESREDQVFIKVNDTGTGIAEEKLEKLFSIDKSSEKGTAGEKGTGLGLMLVKELVELNKGTVQVLSKLNTGSSFMVSLPQMA